MIKMGKALGEEVEGEEVKNTRELEDKTNHGVMHT
jgi:hypothetical protein